MIYVPDLFGSYVKGEQQAIQNNWNDLKNYEDVERARTANDAANLQLQLDQWGFGNEVAKSDRDGTKARIDEQVYITEAPGRIATADTNSFFSQTQNNAVQQLAPQIGQTVFDTAATNLGEQNYINAATNAKNNVRFNLLPSATGAYRNAQTAAIGQSNVNSQIVNDSLDNMYTAGVLGYDTGAVAARGKNYETRYWRENILPIEADNAYNSALLTGENVRNQRIDATAQQDREALQLVDTYQQRAMEWNRYAQSLQNSGAPQAVIDEAISMAKQNADIATGIAQNFNSNGGFGNILGSPFGSGYNPNSQVGDISGFVSTQPYTEIGSNLFLYNQDQEARTAAAGQAAAEQAAVDAVVTQAGGTPETPTGGGGAAANTAVTQTGEVNPYNPNAGDPYSKGSVHRLRTEDGQVMTGTIIGTVTKSDGDYYMVQLPQGGVAHINRDRMNFLTTGNRNSTPNDVVRPGKRAIDYSQWLMPGTPANRPPANQPPRSLVPPRAPTTNLGIGTQQYLLNKNPGGFNR